MSIRDRHPLSIKEIQLLNNQELLSYYADYVITRAPYMAKDHPYRMAREELLKRLDKADVLFKQNESLKAITELAVKSLSKIAYEHYGSSNAYSWQQLTKSTLSEIERLSHE